MDVDEAELLQEPGDLVGYLNVELVVFPVYFSQQLVEPGQRIVWRDSPVVAPYSWEELLDFDPTPGFQVTGR